MTVPTKENMRDERAVQSRPRFRMTIATALTLGFGLLVFVAAASVLGIGLWSARENTINLLRDRAELTIDLLEQRLRDHINPMVESTSAIAALIAAGDIDPDNLKTLGAHMRSMSCPNATGQQRRLHFQRIAGNLIERDRRRFPAHQRGLE
jgi:hypothetical protein